MRLAGGALIALGTGLLTASAACAPRAARTSLPAGLAWPPGQARVALADVIETRRAGAALFSWIGGEKSTPLFERPYKRCFSHAPSLAHWDGFVRILLDGGGRGF